jgi:hypothetical protein
MNQQLPVESRFISKLADQLNAEVVLGTVQNTHETCKESNQILVTSVASIPNSEKQKKNNKQKNKSNL